MTQSLANNNFLRISQGEFRSATKVFARKRIKLGPALLAFEGGFLSIESGEATAVMHAEGEWHGRAIFSAEILRALATVPPPGDPIPVAYADGHLLIGSMTIPCQWNVVSEAFLRNVSNPDLLDLLALERTVARAELRGAGLGTKMRSAREKAERRIRNAAAQLAELEILPADIWELVEARIALRMRRGQ